MTHSQMRRPDGPETASDDAFRWEDFEPTAEERGLSETRKTAASRAELLKSETQEMKAEVQARRSRMKRARTDLGNAERLLDGYRDEIRYDHDRQMWLTWDGIRWSRARMREIEHFASIVARGVLVEAAESNAADKDEFVKFAVRSQSRSSIKAMIASAESMPQVSALTSDFDADDFSINTRSGIVSPRFDGPPVVRPHVPSAMQSMLTGVEYDPAAQCPQWLKFLNDAMLGRQHMVDYLQRCVGYSLIGARREEVVLICYGRGGNGKGTFMEVVADALGDYVATVSANALLSKERNTGSLDPDIAQLPGKRLVIASEFPEQSLLDAAKIKSLSGGDTITCRTLHKEPFSFRPKFQMWIQVNHKLRTADLSLGFRRRVQHIPWEMNVAPADQDKTLKDRLRQELPGILRWAIDGAQAYLLSTEGLNPPQEVLDSTADYFAAMDPLMAFIQDRCVEDRHAKARVADLYAAYTAWCDETGERSKSQRTFGTALKEHGFTDGREGGTGKTLYFGIGLRVDVQSVSPTDGNKPARIAEPLVAFPQTQPAPNDGVEAELFGVAA